MSLKPNMPKTFSGDRDFLKLNAWIYQVDEYFNIVNFRKTDEEAIDNRSKVRFASLLLDGDAALWWFTLVRGS